MSTREQQLIHWLKQCYSDDIQSLESVSGDASFRKYYRFKTSSISINATDATQDPLCNSANDVSLIAVDSPPTHENNQSFIDTSLLLKKHSICVPVIHHYSPQQGFFVLSDFGDDLLLQQLSSQNADRYYCAAIDSLINLQAVPTKHLPKYSAEKLQQEMLLFTEWFLQRHHQLQWHESIQACLDNTYQLLIDNALAQPQTFVHRDFHSRNLMILQNQQIGIIDYQDAVCGPITYDLVSLLRDCYIDWPQNKIDRWISHFHKQIHLSHSIELDQFKHWFDLMGLQRHLKAVGIFCRLNYRDNKATYLNDIPRTLNYMLQVSACYPSLKEFHDFLKSLPSQVLSQASTQ